MTIQIVKKGIIKYLHSETDSRKWKRYLTNVQAVQRVNEGVAIIINENTVQAIFDDDSIRTHIFIRDNHNCRICGLKGNNIRRLIPKSQEGITSPLNCITVCDNCVILPISIENHQMQNKYKFGVNNISGVVISDHGLLRWGQRIDFYNKVNKESISSKLWSELISGNVRKLNGDNNWYSIDNNIFFAAIIQNEKLIVKTFLDCYPYNKKQKMSNSNSYFKFNISLWHNRRRAFN